MSESQTFRRFAQVAQRWRDLVDLRCAYFIEQHASGRWKQYYTEQQFLLLMREAAELAETWAKIAPRPGDANVAGPSVRPANAANPPRRAAA
jgi:uncharacterized repeat protein (TIGR03809 family)